MSHSGKQMELKVEELSSQEEKGKFEGLPRESSPYLKYDDAIYKGNAYGTQGDLQASTKTKPRRQYHICSYSL